MLSAMIPFSLEMPRAIHFGVGALLKLPEIIRDVGRKILIVSGSRWLAGSRWESKIMEGFTDCSVQRLSCPLSEPTSRSLAEASAAAAGFAPDALVAVGGGSVLDTAKALSALLRYPGPVDRFLEGVPGAVPVPGPCLPWVAVPTTAGTGAEATKNAVVRVESLGVKRSMRSSHLLAYSVVVDPQLAASLPASVTGTSGLDALTQLVESYVSRATTPFVQAIVEGAFPLMLDALTGLHRDPENLDLRAKAAYGALVSGIALANAGLGAAHGFAAAVGGMYAVPHGLACAVLLPPVLAANRDVIRDAVGRLVAPWIESSTRRDPVAWLAEEVRSLLSAYGLPSDLRGFHIPTGDIPELAEKSSGASMRGNPRELSMEERISILSRVI